MSDLPPTWGSPNRGDDDRPAGGQPPAGGTPPGPPNDSPPGNPPPGYGGQQPPSYGQQPPAGGPPPYGQAPYGFGPGAQGSADNTQSIIGIVVGILVGLCCCVSNQFFGIPSLGLGIAGAVFSILSMTSRNNGDAVDAASKQKLAWILIGAGAGVGVLAFGLSFAIGAAAELSDF